MHNLMARCHLVMTDSGGLQEEAPALPVVFPTVAGDQNHLSVDIIQTVQCFFCKAKILYNHLSPVVQEAAHKYLNGHPRIHLIAPLAVDERTSTKSGLASSSTQSMPLRHLEVIVDSVCRERWFWSPATVGKTTGSP